MAELSFEIARKLQKPQKGAPGLTLRSLRLLPCGAEAAGTQEPADAASLNQVIVLADEYGMIKELARNTEGVRCRAMGKSLRITADDPSALADFAKALPFNSDEALDVFDFLSSALRSEEYRVLSASLEPGSMSVRCVKEFEGEQIPSEGAEAFYEALSAELDRYSMGIIK